MLSMTDLVPVEDNDEAMLQIADHIKKNSEKQLTATFTIQTAAVRIQKVLPKPQTQKSVAFHTLAFCQWHSDRIPLFTPINLMTVNVKRQMLSDATCCPNCFKNLYREVFKHAESKFAIRFAL